MSARLGGPSCLNLCQFEFRRVFVRIAKNLPNSGGFLSCLRKVVVFGNLNHKSGGFMLITHGGVYVGLEI